MTQIVNSRCVLAVRDLEVSTRYYMGVLGFQKDPINAEGWSFLTRDGFRVMLVECVDANEQAVGLKRIRSEYTGWTQNCVR